MKTDDISADDIVDFFEQHPDFFDLHPETLVDLRIPHASGGAISLVEKQITVLRERNTELRRRLSELLENARENDRIFDRSKRLILALLECNELGDMVDALYYSFDKEFNIPFTQLVLFKDIAKGSNAKFMDSSVAQKHLQSHLQKKRSMNGHLSPEEIEFVFGDEAKHIGSAAITVLHYKETLGFLAVGNPDPMHYHLGVGTLFLSHIGEVLNRLITRQLNNVV